MNRIFCNCLNIILDVVPDGCRKVPGEKLLGDDTVVDPFFASEVLDVKLGLGGIEMQQPLLIQERIVDDWKIFKCSNCALDTHAIHKVKGIERVFGNLKLLRSSEDVQTLKGHREYSQVFKIVLNNVGTGSEEDGSQSTFIFQQSLGPATQLLNGMVKKFLKLQEEAMQERIRLYMEQQKHQFEELQSRATQDKKVFMRILCRKEEKVMKDSLSEAMKDTSFGVGSADERGDQFLLNIPTFTSASKAVPKPQRFDHISNPTGSLPLSRTTPVPSRVLGNKSRELPSRSTRTPNKQQPAMRRRNKGDMDEDTLFDLEGFQDNRNCQPFFESDEESSGDSNSLESSGGFGYSISGRGLAGDRVYATSVPVGIPQMQIQRKQSYEDEEEVEVDVALSPERMAESIKAIARSIQDSTSMFGDLPRPRYNTMPLK